MSRSRIPSAAFVALLGLGIASACKHQDNTQIDKDDEKPKKKLKTETPVKSGKTPEKHRTAHAPCSRVDTPASPTVTYGPKAMEPPGPACASKADCKANANGRCSRGHCTYDGCYEDKDCGKTVCECHEEGIHGYYCKGGDCAVDSDCGDKGYCSPTWGMECGAFTGVIGFFCHTEKDECTDDGECVKEKQKGYCAYDSEKKHWRCGYGQCVG